MSLPDDPRIDEALDLLRAAVVMEQAIAVNLKTALRLIGESRAQQVEEQQEKGPKFFGKRPDPRPATAATAEPHVTEG